MSCDFLSLANSGVQKLSPYQTGKPIDELKRELGLDDIVKLASNENPLGCSPLVVEAIKSELTQIGRYPDGNGFNLKYAIQQKFGFDLNRITLGNGSNDILELVARAFIAEGQSAVYSQHAFAVYPLAVQAVGGVGIEVPAKNYGHDLQAMAQAITANTKVVFIANPNNPTGTWFSRTEFEQFIAQVPEHVIVVLDEAYVEFVTDSGFMNGFDYVNQYPNLLVSRTFSKAYGLASLRVGYAIAHPDITNIINRVRQPFNVNSFALAAATAALQDDDFVAQSCDLNSTGMKQLEQGLTALDLSFIPSKANFIAFDVNRPCQPVFQALLQQGVIVRPIANYGMPTYLRVSIGLASENARFLAVLKQVLS